jgi:hypothetical protein
MDKLDMRYKPGVFVMEDLDFNERLQPELICKCMRYMQKKKKLAGGCDDYVARKEDEPAPPPAPLPAPVPPAPAPPPAPPPAHLRALVERARLDVDDAVSRLEKAGITYELLTGTYGANSFDNFKDDLKEDPPGFSAAQVRALWQALHN